MTPKNESECNGNKLCEFVHETFLDHPHSAGEHYFEHLWYTITVAGHLMLSALCAIIHGLIPKFLPTKTSDRVIALADDMKDRRKHNIQLAAQQQFASGE